MKAYSFLDNEIEEYEEFPDIYPTGAYILEVDNPHRWYKKIPHSCIPISAPADLPDWVKLLCLINNIKV
jgi:hypothetical protein